MAGLVLDTPAKHIYTGDGTTRVYPIPTYIQGDDWIRIEIDGVYIVDRRSYDIVNNNIIFVTAPGLNTQVSVQVATSVEALSQLGNSTNVDTVAGSIGNVNAVATNINNVNITATNIANVNTTATNIDKVTIVANDINSVKTTATNINNVNTTAGNINNVNTVANNISKVNIVATNIVDINQIVDNLPEILLADDNATTATQQATIASTKASEASASANQALTSRNQAETFKNSASTSATTATTKASEASASATTATTKASEASSSATSASTSANQALISRNQAETFAQQAQASALSVDANNIVHRTGNEIIDGIKTFTSNIVGNINGNAATVTNGVYTVDNQIIDGVKTFNLSPIVPTPTNNTDAANKKYVDDVINTGTKGAYGLKWNQEIDTYEVLGATDRTQIQRNMKRCVLKDDGTVNYYLDPYNSTKKADGTPAVLTGADGNVMVEFPKFWYKHELNGNEHQWWVSDRPLTGYSVFPWFLEGGVEVPFRYYRAYTPTVVSGKLRSISGSTPTRSQTRATFRTQARANGTGWGLASWNALNASQLMYLTEYCNFNSQAILGRGNDSGSDYGITTGQSNSIGNASSSSLNNDTWMSYRGIENWYGDCWEFIDGINISNYVVYLSNTPSSFADDTYTGSYSNSGITLPAMSASYIKKISGNFIPTAVGGSSSTFITDGGWSAAGGTLVMFGSDAGSGLIDGGFAFVGDGASGASGARIAAGLTR